jgi:hypothetical protein
MRKGLLMLLIGGVFLLFGLFTMPMKRVNPRQNLVDNPFGWGLFGFGLSSLLVGISTAAKEKEDSKTKQTIEIKEVHFEEDKSASQKEQPAQ